MVESSRILIADDEETFLQSTAELLRREGYHCDCVPDASEAMQKLSKNGYDVLIADIKMPGNTELDLIKKMAKIYEGVPVILVTGYPSLHLAIESIELLVEAYLVKPTDFDQLLRHVRVAVNHHQLYRSVQSTKQRLQCCYEGLTGVEERLKDKGRKGISVSLDAFLEYTFQNIIGVVSDLKHLIAVLAVQKQEKEICHLFNCPRLDVLMEQVVGTIDVLKKSKSAFKSKELGQIRKKLQEFIVAKV